MTLGSILPPFGYPMIFPPEAPMIFPSAHQIQASFALQDTTAAIVGNNTVYGIVLVGALVARRVLE